MKKHWRARILQWGFSIVVVLASVYFFAFAFSPVAQKSDYTFDLSAIRQLEHSGTGSLPTRINGEVIATPTFPHALVAAGAGWGGHPMVMDSVQVVFPDSTLIIDTALDQSMIDAMSKGVPFFPDHYAVMQKAMTQAKTIVFTHEHPDHVGGVAKAPDFAAIAGRIVITREQADSLKDPRLEFPQDRLTGLKPLSYEGVHLLAPGVVLIKAPGHWPGTQIMYVALDNGQEFLFVGDIVWSMENFDKVTGRPWVVSAFFPHEDRTAVAGEIRALHELAINPPHNLHMVVAHDAAQYQGYVAHGWIHDGFDLR